MSGLQSQVLAGPHRTFLLGDTSDAFGIYHDLVQSSGARTTRLGAAFETTVTAYHFARLTLFDRQIVGVEHRRGTPEIARDGFEHFYLQVLRSGRMMSGPPGEERKLAPGDAILFDATLPQRTLVPDADYVTVTLARGMVEAAVPNARSLHGRILAWKAGSVGEVVLSLARGGSGLAASPAEAAGQLIVGLIADVVDAPPKSTSIDETEIDAVRRLTADLFIDAHLHRRDLDVTMIAKGIESSRSALYRAFKPVGGVEREIVRRRLARLRSLILRPGETRPIDVLAFGLGFARTNHCSRAFKEYYGLAPSALRAERVNAGLDTTSELDVGRMREWYTDLNLN